VKNWRKTIGVEEKLDVVSQVEEVQTVDIRHNVTTGSYWCMYNLW